MLAPSRRRRCTESCADSPPRRGSWSTTMPGQPARPSPARRRRSLRAAERRDVASAPAFVMPTTSGTETSFGLQSASVSGPSPGEVGDEPRSTAVAVVELPLRRRACTTHVDEPPRYGGESNDAILVLLDLLDERLPDQRGQRSAGDRLAVELGEHRRERVRVPDPDRDDELGRVADEPGVAVVVRRARLAGDLAPGDRGALPGSRPGRRPRGCW